jgi:putative ABC transport system permease protein
MGIISLALRNLSKRPRRTLLTIAGAAVAAATYILLLSLGQSLQHQVRTACDLLQSELVVQQAGSGFPTTSWISGAQIHALQTVPHVRRSTMVVLSVSSIESTANFIVWGLGPTFPDVPGLRLIEGRTFEPGSHDAVLGHRAARVLELATGDRFELRRRPLTVVGVFNSGRYLLDRGVVLPIELVQGIFRLGDRANLVFLELSDPTKSDRVRAEIERRFPDLEVSLADNLAAQYQQLDVTGVFVRHLAVVALLIAALGVSNVLSVNISERIQELGILRAIGWRRRRVAFGLLVEGSTMAVIGAVCAVPLAQGVLSALQVVDIMVYSAHRVAPATAIEAIVLTGLAGAVGSVPAIIHALRVQPARALRSE